MSGKNVSFILRLPPDLHGRLKKRALALGISLNEMCTLLLNKGEVSDIDMILRRIKNVFGESLLGVLLFGSAARRATHDSSDIDILIVLNRPIKREDYRLLELPEPYSPSIVSFPKTPSGFWYEIALDGVILFDSDERINIFLKDLRQRILHGDIKRLTTHGQGYWV